MKNIKPVFFSALLYVVYYCGMSALSILIAMIPSYIAKSLTHNENIREFTLVISMIVIIVMGLFILFYNDGYRKNVSYDKNIFIKFIISVAFSYIIYFLIGILIKFHVLLYSSPFYLSSFITKAGDITILQNQHFGTLNITFFILLIPMFISSLLGFRLGIAKREKDRNKMMKDSSTTK